MQTLAVLLGLTAVFGMLYFVDEDASWLFIVLFGAWILMPWLALAVGLDWMRPVGRLVAFVGYGGLTAIVYAGVDDSSTGGLGLLFLPLLLSVLLAVVVVGERLVRRRP